MEPLPYTIVAPESPQYRRAAAPRPRVHRPLCSRFSGCPQWSTARAETFIIANFRERLAIIGGTSYAGEIKKTIFTVLNFFTAASGRPVHALFRERRPRRRWRHLLDFNEGRGSIQLANIFLVGAGSATALWPPPELFPRARFLITVENLLLPGHVPPAADDAVRGRR